MGVKRMKQHFKVYEDEVYIDDDGNFYFLGEVSSKQFIFNYIEMHNSLFMDMTPFEDSVSYKRAANFQAHIKHRHDELFVLGMRK